VATLALLSLFLSNFEEKRKTQVLEGRDKRNGRVAGSRAWMVLGVAASGLGRRMSKNWRLIRVNTGLRRDAEKSDAAPPASVVGNELEIQVLDRRGEFHFTTEPAPAENKPRDLDADLLYL